MSFKYTRLEFEIILVEAKDKATWRGVRKGYQVHGTPFDEICPLAVHENKKGWVVSALQNGCRLTVIPQKTRDDAVNEVIPLLKRVSENLLERRLQDMKKVFDGLENPK